jgi:DNA-binding winged helix-turn-helix (wHTH) protein
VVQLPPKAFAVLHYLVTPPNRLVSKQELFDALWPGTVVSDAALLVCIQAIRKALGDTPQAPRFIETVHGRGYRFIAPVQHHASSVTRQHAESMDQPPPPYPLHPPPRLVGREAELRQLHGWMEKAVNGERQIVFVSGEAGIGKTTLVEAFQERIAANDGLWLRRGQCIEHYGPGEAYMPVLEALGRLCREAGGQRFIMLLGQYAPTWLAQRCPRS